MSVLTLCKAILSRSVHFTSVPKRKKAEVGDVKNVRNCASAKSDDERREEELRKLAQWLDI
jgi:hypothetical protein